ncbi:MAG: M3 family metallopeptidase [Pseudohongiellaceae bacterium]
METVSEEASMQDVQQDAAEFNPFFAESPLYLNYPQFDRIENAHYLPAFARGMAEQLTEVEAIANQDAAPTFANTIVPLELSGQLLDRVANVFYALSSAHTNDAIRALEQELAPRLASHDDSILLNRELFARIESLYERRDSLALDPESQRLLERYFVDFVRAGAALTPEQQQRMKEINGEIATLETDFSQNVLSEVNDLAIVVESREELTGLSPARIEAAAEEAAARGLQGSYVIPLLNTSGQPVLSSLQNRDLRERILQTSMSRGSRGGDFDNREILVNVLRLRAERAQLLGYANHAEYILENQTAQTIAAVNQRLAGLTGPAMANAKREAADLQEMIDAAEADFELEAWDWAYYTDRLRQQRFQYDENQLRPYLELNNVLQRGVFHAAEQLFGLRFEERFDLPVYQEDVRVFEVFDNVGTTLGLFIADFYARPSKRGGAWMNAYISQSDLLNTQPVVANHLNITEPPEGEPTLLTFDEVTTMFHEFGHALHGLFSSVEYPYFAGTRVPRDFVEYPSQVNEMWATWPEVLENYAVHHETGEPMPRDLLERVLSIRTFNQGFATTEYLAASIVDQALHQLAPDAVPTAEEVMNFEAEALQQASIAHDDIPPRYRVTYFSHIMGGYSAGYYSYIWSEVLDADTVEWFRENGGLTRDNGSHFRQTLLSRGGSEEAMTLFRNFRGRDPEIGPLLERRGLN